MFTKLFDKVARYSYGFHASKTDGGVTKYRDFTQEYEQIIPYIGWYRQTHEGKDVKALQRLKRMRHGLR